MGQCCCGGEDYKDVKDQKIEKGGKGDVTSGPLKDRGCTDLLCILLFIAHWVGFVFFVMLGVADGNPQKLFMPRDYQGAYCGVEENWNDGPNLKSVEVQTYTMNVTSTIDAVALQAVCSDHAEQALRDLYTSGSATFTQTDFNDYMCACCKMPCGSCGGAREPTATDTDLNSIISGKMVEFTDLSGAYGSLFGSGSANGDMFSNIWSEATKYFVKICSTDCKSDFTSANSTDHRTYTFEPAHDRDYRKAWFAVKGLGVKRINGQDIDFTALLTNAFTFNALPPSICPYPPSKCVPMPGIEFTKLTDYVCTFSMSAQVVGAIGDIAANAIEGTAVGDFAADSEETFGEWVGEIEACIAGIIVTCFCAFVIGLVFLVLLRFFIGVMVYSAICLIFLLFVASGALCYVRSGQCNGTSLLETGQQNLNAATSTGSAIAESAAESGTNFDIQQVLETERISGNGQSYRGVQDQTISGKTCMDWEDQNVNGNYKPSNLSEDEKNKWDLHKNYCRNPVDDFYTIWCYTTDEKKEWETCAPIAVIQPECVHGYEVEQELARDVLRWCGYILWILALLWLIAMWCFRSRIQLAIAVNKVAAMFIYNTPQILAVPIIQVLVGIIWCVLWALAATFLISQVPDDRTPKIAYETFGEAFGYYEGDQWKSGACIGDPPVGEVWKDEDNCDLTDPLKPKCWKCFPPRFVIDYRAWYIFFSFLWNNAMLIACGQVIIAGAVGIWFFTIHEEKRSTAKVGRSVWHLVRYHSGSAAFGSAILAIVQFIRYVMMYLEKQAQVQKNKVMEILMKIGQCCLWCLEKCIKFLNKNAYIQVALQGTNFCRSAKVAFGLIIRNFIRFGIVASLGAMTQWIGILVITIGTTFVGYLIIKGMHPQSNPVVPCVLFVFIGYVISKLYMAVFQMAVDTALQCYIIVEETGGEPADDGAKYVPKPLVGLCPKKSDS